MAGFEITITDAGRAEVINAENTGTDPVTVAEIGVGTGEYAPDPTQTALQNEIKRLSTIAGSVVADDTVHVTVRDEGPDDYTVYEFGLYLASGTLFAVYSQVGTPVIDKSSTSILLLAVDVILTTLNATSLTFGDTEFINPPATTTTPGVAELATDTETQAGADGTRAVTPKSLKSLTATDTRAGLIERATTAEAQAGNDGERAMTPAKTHDAFKQFGLGYWTPISDANNATKSGLYSLPLALGAANAPVPNESGALLVINGGADEGYIAQQWISANDTEDQKIFFRHRRGLANGWTGWVTFATSASLGTAAFKNVQTSKTDATLGAVMINGAWGLGGLLEIGDANLALSSGLYSLPASLGALNSPVPGVSGTLTVVSGGVGLGYVTQTWIQSNATNQDRIFIRHRRDDTGEWVIWKEILSGMPNWINCEKLVSNFDPGFEFNHAICGISKTSLAYIGSPFGSNDNYLRLYDFDGTSFTENGSQFLLPFIGKCSVTALSDTDIVVYSPNQPGLYCYRRSGSSWAQVGSSFSIGPGTSSINGIAAVSRTDVVISYEDSGARTRRFNFDGLVFSLVGTQTLISGAFAPTVTALTEDIICIYVGSPARMYALEWDGNNYADIGSINISSGSTGAITAINRTDVVFVDSNNSRFRVYRFDQSGWRQIGYDSYFGDVDSRSELATLSGGAFCFMDDASNLSALFIKSYPQGVPHSTVNENW